MSVAEQIYKHYEDNAEESGRGHLGGSLIGRKCERMLWYSFRWATNKKFEGRILRLFQRGHREEPEFIRELRDMGAEVHAIDTNGKQFGFKDHGGHFAGSYDGAARYIPGAANSDWYLLEFKTHGEKSYARLLTAGVQKAKPEHYAQMQVYMHYSGLKQALYLAVCKNDDHIYDEEIAYDEQYALRMINKARHIIGSDEPPARCTEDPTYFECRFCDHKAVCWHDALPEVNCRTCAHSTPEPDGEQRWSCACEVPMTFDLAPGSICSAAINPRTGCSNHIYIPALLPWEFLGGSDEDNHADYRTKDGTTIRNSNKRGSGCYTSKELQSIGTVNNSIFADQNLEAMRDRFGAFFTPKEGGDHAA